MLDRLEARTKIQERKVVPNEVISMQKNENVSKVVKLMKEHGYSHIPVFNGNQSVGTVETIDNLDAERRKLKAATISP